MMKKQVRHSATFKAQVVMEMLQEEKTVAQIAAEHSIHPGQLHRWKRQALDNFANLFTEPQVLRQQAEGHEQERLELYAKIGQLTTQLEWLKKNLASTLSRGERVDFVDRSSADIPLATQTQLLSLNRSSRPLGRIPRRSP